MLCLVLGVMPLPGALRAQRSSGSISASHQPKAFADLVGNLQDWLAHRDASKVVAPYPFNRWGTWDAELGKRPLKSVKGAVWNIFKLKEGLYLVSLRRDGAVSEQESFVIRGDMVSTMGAWQVSEPIDRRGLEFLVKASDCPPDGEKCAHGYFIVYGDARVRPITFE